MATKTKVVSKDEEVKQDEIKQEDVADIPAALSQITPKYNELKEGVIIDVEIPLAVEDSRVPNGFIRVLLDKDAVDSYNQARDDLYLARGIPFDIEQTSTSDLLPLYYITEGGMDRQPAINRSKFEYKSWAERTFEDAYLIGLTRRTKLVGAVTPYPEKMIKDKSTLEDWEVELKITHSLNMPHDLNNPFEKRLKLIQDISEDQGFMWRNQFRNIIQDAVAIFIREAAKKDGDEKDKDGFPPESIDSALHVVMDSEVKATKKG